MKLRIIRIASALWVTTVLACSANPTVSDRRPGVTGGAVGAQANGGEGGKPPPFAPPLRGGSSGGGGAGGSPAALPPPGDFTKTEVGGYKLGDPVTGGGAEPGLGNDGKGCNVILGVVRDFRGTNMPGGHPDFEFFFGNGATLNIVADTLGSDHKPVYTSMCEVGGMLGAACPHGAQTTTKANFDQWYRSIDGLNKPYLVYFKFELANGISTFRSDQFFPLDGAGFDPPAMRPGQAPRNFSFTTELHTKFKYNGGETFTFDGDDDLWVFINNKLALDLGGLHPSVMGTIDLDQSAAKLGISKGTIYPMELFHAERHSSQSHFRVDTNLAFVDCGTIIK